MAEEEATAEKFFVGCRAFGALLHALDKADADKLSCVLEDAVVREALPDEDGNASTAARLVSAAENFALLELCTLLSKEEAAAVSRELNRASSVKVRMHERVMELGLVEFVSWCPPHIVQAVARVLGLCGVGGCSDEWFGSLEARHAIADELFMVGTMRMLETLGKQSLRSFCRAIHARVPKMIDHSTMVDHAMRVIFRLRLLKKGTATDESEQGEASVTEDEEEEGDGDGDDESKTEGDDQSHVAEGQEEQEQQHEKEGQGHKKVEEEEKEEEEEKKEEEKKSEDDKEASNKKEQDEKEEEEVNEPPAKRPRKSQERNKRRGDLPPISRLDVVCTPEQLEEAYTKRELAYFCSRHGMSVSSDAVKSVFASAVSTYLHEHDGAASTNKKPPPKETHKA